MFKQKNSPCENHLWTIIFLKIYINIHELISINISADGQPITIFKRLVDYAPFFMIGWSIWLTLILSRKKSPCSILQAKKKINLKDFL